MAELVDAEDSKSSGPQTRASSSLALGIIKSNTYGFFVEVVRAAKALNKALNLGERIDICAGEVSR